MKRSRTRWMLAIALLAGLGFAYVFFGPGLSKSLTLQNLKHHRDGLIRYYSLHPAVTMTVYVGFYILFTALSIPEAAVLSLAGGAILAWSSDRSSSLLPAPSEPHWLS